MKQDNIRKVKEKENGSSYIKIKKCFIVFYIDIVGVENTVNKAKRMESGLN